MKDNRFCDNIGRAHKSNNIIWNVHLIDRICWQSCHDPECRGFRGEAVDLPEEVCLEIDEYFLDYELSSLNENDIIEGNESSIERGGALAPGFTLPVEEGHQPPPPATADDDGEEFDNPALEAAMRQLDIAAVARGNEGDAALDDAIAKLNLSDAVSANQTKNDASGKSVGEDNFVTSPQPWENDDDLDSELAKIRLSDIVPNCGKS
jgi:hypothetical protein